MIVYFFGRLGSYGKPYRGAIIVVAKPRIKLGGAFQMLQATIRYASNHRKFTSLKIHNWEQGLQYIQ